MAGHTDQATELTDVGAVDDFEPGAIASRRVRGREVAVVRWGDEIFAVGNDCPHQGGPFCKGHVGPLIKGNPDGSIDLDPDRLMIACAWHGWEFDLRDGASVWDESVRIRVYRVEIADGRVLVGSRGARRSRAPRKRGDGDA